MPWSGESRKRPLSEMLEIYAGPEDFMEAGARGFLITTIPEREEPAIDQAMKMLRKACVKLYGGMKPQVKSTTALFSNGYIAVDFMDPDAVTVLPNPELKLSKTAKDQGEAKEEEEDDKEKSEKNGEDPEDAQMAENEKEAEEKEEEKEGEGEDVQKEEEMEKEGGDAEEQDEEMEADKSVDKSAEAEEDATEQSNTKEKSKEGGEEKKNKEGEDDSKASKAKESPEKRGNDSGKSKADSQKSKSSREEERRKRDNKRRKREVDTTPKWPLMKAPYKFKAFRTELRNIMFIKSNIPDPLVLVREIMDLILNRQPLKADSINQLLPIQGICNYSYWELEVMSRRVLAPFFPEDSEEPPSFGILMYDKLCEPGADVLAEIVRSAIWSINPMAWQGAPLSDIDVTIHLELVGSKIVLSAMTYYMKYRQYSPFCVAEMGEGKPEDPEEQDRRRAEREKERPDTKGRSRSRSDRPHKTEDTPSGKGKEKDKADDGHEKDEAKKDGKDKTEESSEKEEKKGEDGEKSQEEGKESGKKEEATEPGEKEWRKTRRGKRGGVRKQK